jgi:hypothetical protein
VRVSTSETPAHTPRVSEIPRPRVRVTRSHNGPLRDSFDSTLVRVERYGRNWYMTSGFRISPPAVAIKSFAFPQIGLGAVQTCALFRPSRKTPPSSPRHHEILELVPGGGGPSGPGGANPTSFQQQEGEGGVSLQSKEGDHYGGKTILGLFRGSCVCFLMERRARTPAKIAVVAPVPPISVIRFRRFMVKMTSPTRLDTFPRIFCAYS